MAKIQLTENDIINMTHRVVKTLRESIRNGVSTGFGTWEPVEELLKAGYPEEVVENLPIKAYYDITAKQSSTEYSGEDGPGNVSSYSGDKVFGGDYDTAVSEIEQVQDESIKQALRDNLAAFCENLSLEDFEEGDYDGSRGDINEGLDGGQQSESGQVYTFDNLESFEHLNNEMGLEMRAADIWVNPGVRHIEVICYPASVSLDDSNLDDSNWHIDGVKFEYGAGEMCRVGGKDVPLTVGKIKWLDDFVKQYIANKKEQIIGYIYGEN